MRIADRGSRKEPRRRHNDRGVALIIVLLVTALLIALIFEFAYGTRVSLRAAVNFRNSQRAYYLARSGVNFVGRYLAGNLQFDPGTGKDNRYDKLEQQEWLTVPFLPGNDAELRVRWEDEAGKIRITDVQTNPYRQIMLNDLFENKGIDRTVFDRMTDSSSEIKTLGLVTGLHQYMSDEDYNKVNAFVTTSQVDKIDINTASAEVLQSLGISADEAGLIIEARNKAPFTDHAKVSEFTGINTFLPTTTLKVANFLIETSNVFKVYSYATVGGYTKQVEAVITRSNAGFSVQYWRAF
jgi:type II secretory pathway component PulK